MLACGPTSSPAASPRLTGRREHSGLIVNTIAWAYGAYLGNVPCDTAEAVAARPAFGFAHDLRPRNVAAVAVAPAIWAPPRHRSTWAGRSPRSRAIPA